jgi:hypothetical protein
VLADDGEEVMDVALVGRIGGTPVTVVVAEVVVEIDVGVGVLLVTVLKTDNEVVVGTGVVVLTTVLTIVVGTTTIEVLLIGVEDGVTITVELKTPIAGQFLAGH